MITSQKINFTGLDSVAKKAVGKFHPAPEKLSALRQNYAEKETLFGQGHIGDCYLIALKSVMFGLNEYANKTNQQCYNARNWVRKLIVKENICKRNWLEKLIGKENNYDAGVFFPVLKKIKAKIIVNKEDLKGFPGSQGNKKIDFLEYGYGILTKWSDLSKKEGQSVIEVLDGGNSLLAITDVTGLKAGRISQADYGKEEELKKKEDLKQVEELFKKHTDKLFKKFQKNPENLILIAGTKDNVPEFFTENHAYVIKKVVDDGLIIVNPKSKTNEEINVNFDDFYKYFKNVDFARLRPEKMFKMIEETKKAVKDSPVLKFSDEPNFKPLRDSSKYSRKKGHVFFENFDTD